MIKKKKLKKIEFGLRMGADGGVYSSDLVESLVLMRDKINEIIDYLSKDLTEK